VDCSGITIIQNFMKASHLARKLVEDKQTAWYYHKPIFVLKKVSGIENI
jgi:hypothetical protein